jgi:hypothetical protein
MNNINYIVAQPTSFLIFGTIKKILRKMVGSIVHAVAIERSYYRMTNTSVNRAIDMLSTLFRGS